MATHDPSTHVPDTDDEQIEKQLTELAEQIIEAVDGRKGDDTLLNEWFIKYHNITIGQYLEYVKTLVENGMTFSAARSYAIEQYSNENTIGTHAYPDHQAELIGVSVESHRQLAYDGSSQIEDAEGLYYNNVTTRPLEIKHTHVETGFSDFTEGSYMDEHNPTHHAIRVVVGEYVFTPFLNDDDVDLKAYREAVNKSNTDDTLPKFAVFFEIYTGDGMIKIGQPIERQGNRLHSIETAYCQTEEEVFLAIADKFEYSDTTREDAIIQDTADELGYGVPDRLSE